MGFRSRRQAPRTSLQTYAAQHCATRVPVPEPDVRYQMIIRTNVFFVLWHHGQHPRLSILRGLLCCCPFQRSSVQFHSCDKTRKSARSVDSEITRRMQRTERYAATPEAATPVCPSGPENPSLILGSLLATRVPRSRVGHSFLP